MEKMKCSGFSLIDGLRAILALHCGKNHVNDLYYMNKSGRQKSRKAGSKSGNSKQYAVGSRQPV